MKSEEFDSALVELEERFERLRTSYEDYFAGTLSKEPSDLREDVDRRILALRSESIRNERSSAKFSALVARYQSFQQYWARVGTRLAARARVKRLSNSPLRRITLPGMAAPAESSRAAIVARDWRRTTPPLGTPAMAHALMEPDSSPAPESGGEPPAPKSETTPTTPPAASVTESAKTAPNLRLLPQSGAPRSAPALRESAPKALASHGASTRTTPVLDDAVVKAALAAAGDDLSPACDDDSDTLPRLRSPVSSAPPKLMAAERDAPPGLPRARVVEIHAKLRSLSPPSVRPVSLQRLSRALEEVEAKLKAEHGECTVTFDVVFKDGKALVKPVVR